MSEKPGAEPPREPEEPTLKTEEEKARRLAQDALRLVNRPPRGGDGPIRVTTARGEGKPAFPSFPGCDMFGAYAEKGIVA